MKIEYFISIFLDTRRTKKDGTYPVKLRVFTPEPRQQKLYGTIFSFSEEEFKSIWETTRPRERYKPLRKKLAALEAKAEEVAGSLNTFNFDDFERLMFGNTNTKINVNYYFQKIIERFKAKGSISTATGYNDALKCLKRFVYSKENPRADISHIDFNEEPVNIDFKKVTVSFLEQFEKFCVEKEEKSRTTVSIYARNLRAVFNQAIQERMVSPDLYPFGKGKYQIQAPKKVKKALTSSQLKKLYEQQPQTPEQEKAKAFWFFSYLSNGMNFKDILQLRWKDIQSDKIKFYRAKTLKTTQTPTELTVYLNDFTLNVIKQYGSQKRSQSDYVFPVLNDELTPEEVVRKKNAFIRFVNQHFLKYAESLEIDEKVSTYWARHSFSTMAIRKGLGIEFVGEALGHTDIKTTMGYFAGFDDDSKKDIAKTLLDFE